MIGFLILQMTNIMQQTLQIGFVIIPRRFEKDDSIVTGQA
jgi:hypothetical protein